MYVIHWYNFDSKSLVATLEDAIEVMKEANFEANLYSIKGNASELIGRYSPSTNTFTKGW